MITFRSLFEIGSVFDADEVDFIAAVMSACTHICACTPTCNLVAYFHFTSREPNQ